MGERGKKAPAQNLTDAALYLLGVRRGPSPELIADYRAMGAPQAVIDQVSEAAKEREIFDVLPENWDAVRLFNAVRTQWRIGGMAGIPTGLDYPAVEMVMNRLGFDDAAFAQLQLMETTALQHWADTRT